MTVQECINKYKGKYTDISVYLGQSLEKHLCDIYHPLKGYGYCRAGQEDRLYSYLLDFDVKEFALYNRTSFNYLLENDNGFYNDKSKILCILVSRTDVFNDEKTGL